MERPKLCSCCRVAQAYELLRIDVPAEQVQLAAAAPPGLLDAARARWARREETEPEVRAAFYALQRFLVFGGFLGIRAPNSLNPKPNPSRLCQVPGAKCPALPCEGSSARRCLCIVACTVRHGFAPRGSRGFNWHHRPFDPPDTEQHERGASHSVLSQPEFHVGFRSVAQSCSLRWHACCARAAWRTSRWRPPRMACSPLTLRCLVRTLHHAHHHESRAAVGLGNSSGL